MNNLLKRTVRPGCYCRRNEGRNGKSHEDHYLDILGNEGERRKNGRDKNMRSGVALSHDGQSREACVIANLSDTGALLLVEKPGDIDNQLVVVIDGEKQRRPARVVWRTEAAVAVSFLTATGEESAGTGWVFAPSQQPA